MLRLVTLSRDRLSPWRATASSIIIRVESTCATLEAAETKLDSAELCEPIHRWVDTKHDVDVQASLSLRTFDMALA